MPALDAGIHVFFTAQTRMAGPRLAEAASAAQAVNPGHDEPQLQNGQTTDIALFIQASSHYVDAVKIPLDPIACKRYPS
jgi:hypothetical protein